MDLQHGACRENCSLPRWRLLSGMQSTLMLTAGPLQVALRGG